MRVFLKAVNSSSLENFAANSAWIFLNLSLNATTLYSRCTGKTLYTMFWHPHASVAGSSQLVSTPLAQTLHVTQTCTTRKPNEKAVAVGGSNSGAKVNEAE